MFSSLQAMEHLITANDLESQKLYLEDRHGKTVHAKRPAPHEGGCRIEGFVQVKKVNSLY